MNLLASRGNGGVIFILTSADGKSIIFDSTHEGDGRQIYLMDISNLAEIHPSE